MTIYWMINERIINYQLLHIVVNFIPLCYYLIYTFFKESDINIETEPVKKYLSLSDKI